MGDNAMSGTDLGGKVQAMILGMISKSDGMPDAKQMLAGLADVLEEARDEGLLTPDAAEARLAELRALQASSAADLAGGDYLALDEMMQKLGVFPASGGAPTHDMPEIFDAIEDGDVARVKAALRDWDVNRGHGEYDATALYRAMSNMFGVSLEIAHLLLDAGADPAKGLTQTNVLHGLGFGRCDGVPVQDLAALVRRCVALGADIEERSDKLQWTPLHTAVNEWNEPAVEALLIAGADPNACAGSENRGCTAGESALSMAIGRSASFELLLAHGADPDAVDGNGRTACGEVARLLRDAEEGDFREDLQRCQAALDRRGAVH